MILSKTENEQFYGVMLLLQFFAARETGCLPEIETWGDYLASPNDSKTLARNALFEDPKIIGEFLSANPNALSLEDQELARKWEEHHIVGNFFIERHLKAHSIWIGADGPDAKKVYAVHGLAQPMEELMPKAILPQLVGGVLLPYKGRIIYDGLLSGHNISFGSGYRANLREIYMTAKQNGRIIESLDPSAALEEVPTPAKSRDWIAEVTALKAAVSKLKGEKDPILKEVFATCRRAVELVEFSTTERDDLEGIAHDASKVINALRRLDTAIDRADKW